MEEEYNETLRNFDKRKWKKEIKVFKRKNQKKVLNKI